MIANFNSLVTRQSKGNNGFRGIVNFNPWQTDPTSIPTTLRGLREFSGKRSGMGALPLSVCAPPGPTAPSHCCLALALDPAGNWYDCNELSAYLQQHGCQPGFTYNPQSGTCYQSVEAQAAGMQLPPAIDYSKCTQLTGAELETCLAQAAGNPITRQTITCGAFNGQPVPYTEANALKCGMPYNPYGTVAPSTPGVTPLSAETGAGGAAQGETVNLHGGNTGVSFSFQNITNPLQATNLKVGDQWKLVINGPPNTKVYSNGGKNGAVSNNFYLGTTDSNGQLIITGSAGSGDVGNWVQWYTIGSEQSSTLNFSISTQSAVQPEGTPGTMVGSGISTPSTTTPTASATGFLEENVSLAGFNIPMWMLLAGAGAGLYFMSGRHKR